MKKKAKKRARKPRIKIEVAAEQPIGTDGGEQKIGDDRVTEMITAARNVAYNEGCRVNTRIRDKLLIDGICARIAFYKMSRMTPVTMTLSWHEALVILDALEEHGYGIKEHTALAMQKQWRVRPADDGSNALVASHE